jgi:bifunctional DNA-binding transcriptional regulator/antitoxin component of YhaV-PrlF toxin-antitoxin module
MRISDNGAVIIPLAIRTKHGFLPSSGVACVDRPVGVLVVKAGKAAPGRRALAAFGSGVGQYSPGKAAPGRRALAALLRGGRVKARTADWLRLTRGAA